MGGVIGIELDISSSSPRTADPGDHGGFGEIDAARLHGDQARGENSTDAASRAPDVRDAVGAQKSIQWVV
jgi:hypothetical protein